MKLKKLDNYYKQAVTIADMSPDEQTKVGALLINGKTGAVLGSGYNGFIRGACDHKLPKTRPDKYPYMVHAEANLLCNSARHGISTDDCFVFCTLSPCVNCLRLLYQAGISVVYFKDKYSDFDTNLNMLDIEISLTQESIELPSYEGSDLRNLIYRTPKIIDISPYTMITLSPRSL